MRRLAPVLAALVLAGAAPRARADAPAERASVEVLIGRLRSPFRIERDAAVADLSARGTEARAAVIAAFRTGDRELRLDLVRVLAADGSKEALDVLLEALPSLQDAATATVVQASLVEHAEQVADTVSAWRDESGKVPPRVAELATLLQRARIEARFLSRKSSSGGTGSYPGQFDVLKPDRRAALEVCLDIFLDRAPKRPGRFPTGTYRFLRPPSFFVDSIELRAMALHAIAELATPDDRDVLDALAGSLDTLEEAIAARGGRFWAPVEAALADGVLATMAKLRGQDPTPERYASEDRPAPRGATWRELADETVEWLARQIDHLDDAAALALQLTDFRRAVQLYERLRMRSEGAIPAYNLACALARWSREPGELDPSRLRARALLAITDAVDSGYADWAWMEQDRDLDPIRDEPGFKALLQRMKAEPSGAATPTR